jgi:hypothetical protein
MGNLQLLLSFLSVNFFFFGALGFGSLAYAETSTLGLPKLSPLPTELTPTSSSSSMEEYNQDFEYIDKLIDNGEFTDDHKLTDLRLRAQDGSLSRYSFSTSMTFRGPSVGDPSAPDLPNPDKRVGNYSQTLAGNVGARYRFTSDKSIEAGSGISFNHPLQGTDRTDASTPFVSYNWADKISGWQMLISPGVSYATTPEITRVGEIGSFNFMAGCVRDIEGTRFAISLESRSALNVFNRGYFPGRSYSTSASTTRKYPSYSGSRLITGGDGNSQQYSLSAGPGAKYHISDHLELFSFLNIPFYNPMSAEDLRTILPNSPTAFLGMGYSYDRDIYLAPGIQTYPTIMSPDTTTVTASLIFSVL